MITRYDHIVFKSYEATRKNSLNICFFLLLINSENKGKIYGFPRLEKTALSTIMKNSSLFIFKFML